MSVFPTKLNLKITRAELGSAWALPLFVSILGQMLPLGRAPRLAARAIAVSRRGLAQTHAGRMAADPEQFVLQGKKIVAIGRNYAEHIKELSNDAPKEPMFFLKPTSSYVPSGGSVEIPRGVIAHHEVELGLVVGKAARDVPQTDAMSYVAGYALAVDMTARNVQDAVKKKGHPWSAAKGFDTFTPIGTYIPKSSVPDPHSLQLTLKVNGVTKQDGNTDQMIFKIPRMIEHISSIMTLEAGDLVLTGTPSGVGPLKPGDHVECTITDSADKQLASLEFDAVQREGRYSFQS